jgi:hypothetical protein
VGRSFIKEIAFFVRWMDLKNTDVINVMPLLKKEK